MKSFLKITLLGALCAFMGFGATRVEAVSTNIVIYEMYGAGGNTSAALNADYATLFNLSTNSVSIAGWSIQYSSATGSSWSSGNVPLPSVSIPAGGYYTVKFAGGAVGSAYNADYTNTLINMAAAGGKLALVNVTNALVGANPLTNTAIVDFVGSPGANAYEGTAPAPAMSITNVIRRNNGGCNDTDSNTNDFTQVGIAGGYQPNTASTAVHSCAVLAAPVISSVTPSSISTNAGSTVAYTVALSAGGAPLYYYWYFGSVATANLIAGQTNAILTLSNINYLNAGNYYVVVSNATAKVTNASPVTLSVTDPVFSVEPLPTQTWVQGATVSLAVTVGGASPTYQWYLGSPGSGTPISNGGRISGATSSALVISNVASSDAGSYYVTATDGNGSITSYAITSSVTLTGGMLAYWDFNGNFNFNNPIPAEGYGSASATNAIGYSAVSGTGIPDGYETDPEGLASAAWGTSTYPATAVSNLTGGIQFNVSTVGAQNVKLGFDVRETTTASKYYRLQYTTNGTTFTNFPVANAFASSANTFQTNSYDLTGYPGVANNPNFGVRVVAEFQSTAGYGSSNGYIGATATYATSGTMTYDLVTFTGDTITNLANTPPTISPIANVSIPNAGGSTNITVTVGDAETPGSLTVSAFSFSNTVVNASASGNTVTLTPGGTLGSTVVEVLVTDGGGASTATFFTVTTFPYNYPPVVTGIYSTNTLVNVPISLPFTLSDDHTAATGLTVTVSSGNTTLVPNANISITGSGASRTLTLINASNALGVAPITLSVADNDPSGSLTTNITFTVMVQPSTNVVLDDYFTYNGTGSIITNSAGFWQTHSGTAGQMQVGSGILTVDSVNNTEDVNAQLLGAPYPTNTDDRLWVSYTVNYTTLPTATGGYISHFKDNTTFGFLGRIYGSTNNAATGFYRLGVGNSSDASTNSPQVPMDLAPNSNYVVVCSLQLSNAFSTLYINPTSTNSPHVYNTTSVTTNLVQIYSYAFRESSAPGGIQNVSNLRVGKTFSSVVDVLTITPVGTNVVLTWENASFGLQSSTNAAGPYTTIPGATSPYTTGASGAAVFYRLGH